MRMVPFGGCGRDGLFRKLGRHGSCQPSQCQSVGSPPVIALVTESRRRPMCIRDHVEEDGMRGLLLAAGVGATVFAFPAAAQAAARTDSGNPANGWGVV